jgi:hypothetical protein
MATSTRASSSGGKATEVAGEHAEHHADDQRADDDKKADEQRIACAMDETRENIASHRVRAQNEARIALGVPDRRLQERVAILHVRQVRRDQRRENGDEDEDGKNGKTDDGAAIDREIVPEFTQARGRGGAGSGVCRGHVTAPGCAD